MNLYKITVEYQTVVRAASLQEAEREAVYGIGKEIDEEPVMVDAEEITSLKDLPVGWNAQCRPWGETDPFDRTIEQMLSKTKTKLTP